MENNEQIKVDNQSKKKIGVIIAVVFLLLIAVLIVLSVLDSKEDTQESYETKQVTAYSNRMTEVMEKAKTMQMEEAKSYVVTEIYDTNELYGGYDSVDYMSNQLLVTTMTDESTTVEEFIKKLKQEVDKIVNDVNNGVDDLINKGNENVLKATATMKSNTVCQEEDIDSKYCVEKLNARIYIANPNSDKWAVLVHGNMMSGSLMYSSVGSMYTEQGYNVLAPDLRGFGSSDGSVSMGYLESLDVYDWIKDLNENWNNKERYGVNVEPQTIIVHGISLGGATTLQLATNPDIAAASSSPYTKTLEQLHVKGFVDDCGYTSMSGIITGMLSMGETVDLTAMLSSLNIDLDEFMNEFSKIANEENVPGFEQFDASNLQDSDFNEMYQQMMKFQSEYEKLDKEINKYINSDGKYQIPGYDQENIDKYINKYNEYIDDKEMKDKVNDIIQKSEHIDEDEINENLKDAFDKLEGLSQNTNIQYNIVKTSTTQTTESMLEGLVAKALMNLVGVGLTEENYAKYSDVFSEGRKFPNGSKVMVIHGTADTTVPHSNADIVAKNVSPGILVHKWDAESQPHAFIVVGVNKEEYTSLVTNFQKCINDTTCINITR